MILSPVIDTAVVFDEAIVNASDAVSFTNTPLVNSFIDSSCPSFKYTASLKNESLVVVLTVDGRNKKFILCFQII